MVSIDFGFGVISGILFCSVMYGIGALISRLSHPMESIETEEFRLEQDFTIKRSVSKTEPGAPYRYEVYYFDNLVATIPFLTHSPRDTVDGVRAEDLLVILIDRYVLFQEGKYPNPRNVEIIKALRHALWIQMDRMTHQQKLQENNNRLVQEVTQS